MTASRTRAPKPRRQVVATTKADGEQRTTLARNTRYSIDVRIGYPGANDPPVRPSAAACSPSARTAIACASSSPRFSRSRTKRSASRPRGRSGSRAPAKVSPPPFYFHSGNADAFGARIVILFENRVLSHVALRHDPR